ncbi:MAG TPA: enoyl-CoA hydratase/isomerase family protein, partial [Miltoncostaeaceae bacterium]|nr:enoyl-CoA hydratase/isomerase family protein [Miltoncostaeaceae bacterium]
MSGSDKGYRRFRTRGGADPDGPPAAGLSELRALTDRGTRRAEAPPRHRREERPLEASPRERERRAERERRRRERRWWSLRGLGPGGWIGRIAVLLLVGFAVWATAGFLVLRGAVSDSNARITPAARAALDPPTGGMLGTPTNTLILGVDARRGETRAVVLAADGEGFPIGGDMRRFAAEMAGPALQTYAAELVGLLNQAVLALLRLPQPVVAAVHGHVTGGSLGLVLACDLAVMADDAVLKAHYATAGFTPDGGWTALLPRLVGTRRAAAC